MDTGLICHIGICPDDDDGPDHPPHLLYLSGGFDAPQLFQRFVRPNPRELAKNEITNKINSKIEHLAAFRAVCIAGPGNKGAS